MLNVYSVCKFGRTLPTGDIQSARIFSGKLSGNKVVLQNAFEIGLFALEWVGQFGRNIQLKLTKELYFCRIERSNTKNQIQMLIYRHYKIK